MTITGVVGLPNVGKSSLINSLKRKHAAATGNTPGVTTAVQEVHLDKKITLLDSPGIVFSAAGNAHAALLNCTKVRGLSVQCRPLLVPHCTLPNTCWSMASMVTPKGQAFMGSDRTLDLCNEAYADDFEG